MLLRSLPLALLLAAGIHASAQIKATNGPVTRLTLEQAIVLALENNFLIAIQRLTTEMSFHTLRASQAVYDPLYSLNFAHNSQIREGQFSSGSGLQAPDSISEVDSVRQSIGGYLPTGLTYDLGLSFDHRTGSAGGGTFDQYGTSFGFTSLTQPLLRDLWIDSQRRDIKIARINRDMSDLEFEWQVSQIINSVRRAYYDLIAADESARAAYSSYQAAKQLAEDTRREVAIGSKAPLADKEAESTAQLRLSDHYSALHNRNAAENELKNLTGRKYRDVYEGRIEPDEKLLRIERRGVDVQESWKTALEKRPDYRSYFFRLEQERINVRFSRNQVYPALDLVGNYSRSGLDSTTGAPFNQGSFGGAFHDIKRNSQPTHTFGVVLSTPLTLLGPRSNLKRAKASQEQVSLQLQSLEQNILVEIDTTISLIRSSNMRIQSARAAREAAEQALDAGEKKRLNGVATPSEVLQLQDRVTQAQAAEVQALLDYNKALNNLDLQDGTILQRNNIQLQTTR